MARHLGDIDAADMVKAGRGLSHMDEALDAAKAGRYADEVADAAGMGRYADEALDAATANRLRNLDNFTGGNQAAKQGDELREALTNNRAGATLKERRLATKAWKRSGADLDDPVVRQTIRNGEFPSISGGSGKFDDNFLAPVRDRLDKWVAQGRITRQDADEAIEAVEKYVPQNNPLGRAIEERHGITDGGKVNCHGFALCVYPRDYKNQKPIAQYPSSDNYNAFGKKDDLFYTGENGVKKVRPAEELAQMPDKVEILLRKNFDEIEREAAHVDDVISWQEIGPVYPGAKAIKEEVTHTGIYVQKNGDLIFSKLGPGKYLVLPRSVLDKVYGGSRVRYWRPRQ